MWVENSWRSCISAIRQPGGIIFLRYNLVFTAIFFFIEFVWFEKQALNNFFKFWSNLFFNGLSITTLVNSGTIHSNCMIELPKHILSPSFFSGFGVYCSYLTGPGLVSTSPARIIRNLWLIWSVASGRFLHLITHNNHGP